MKKVLVSILVLAMLASVSITAFAAKTVTVGNNQVTGYTWASGMEQDFTDANFTVNPQGIPAIPAVPAVPAVAAAPAVPATFDANNNVLSPYIPAVLAKDAVPAVPEVPARPTITLIQTAAASVKKDWHFIGWNVSGQCDTIKGTATDKTWEIEPKGPITVTEMYEFRDSSATKIGEFEISLFSYASGYFLNAGTAKFDRYDNGTSIIRKSPFLSEATGLPLMNTASMLTPNFMVNPDGTVTLTRSKSEYAFVGWVLDGDYQIVAGNAGSDSITISVVNGHGETAFGKLGADGYWADVPVMGVYEMYDVTPLIRDTAKDVFDKLKKLVDDYNAKKDAGKETTTAAPAGTTKPNTTAGKVDNGTKSPGTGGSNLPSLAVVILLSSTVAIVAKKRYTA